MCAYNTIPRDKLWEKLRRIGVSDEFVQAVFADGAATMESFLQQDAVRGCKGVKTR